MRTKFILPFSLFLVLLLAAAARAESHSASTKSTYSKSDPHVARTSGDVNHGRGLARVTAYWPGEDHWTTHKMSATGVRLRKGFCAVDSSIIPYGSVVNILGLGSYIAVDTGSAVISRKAARESGHNPAERGAFVIDLYFPSRRAGERFSRQGPKFAMVAWQSAEVAADD